MTASPEAIAAQCRIYRAEGKLAEAEALLRGSIERHPRNVLLLIERVLQDNLTDSVRERPPRATRETANYPPIEILVCVHNALEHTKACLDSIVQNTSSPYFLTIVDDASTAEVRDYLGTFAATHPHTRLLLNETNLGYAKSNNRGLLVARADWIVLLNSDTLVTSGWLEGLIECALSDKTIAAVGPLSNRASYQSIPTTPESTPEGMAQLVKALSSRRYPKVPFLCGFCVLVRVGALKEIDYLDESNFSDYSVDGNMSLALLNQSGKLAVADDVYVHHASAASFGGGEKRERMIADGRRRLKAIWPDYDAGIIGETSRNELAAIRKKIAAALPGSSATTSPGESAHRARSFIKHYSKRALGSLISKDWLRGTTR